MEYIKYYTEEDKKLLETILPNDPCVGLCNSTIEIINKLK